MKPEKELSGEELSRYVAKLFEEKGRKALEIARNAMAGEIEKLECEEAREALKYFMNEYWQDTTRPALLWLACEALGGNPEATIPIAVPLILIAGAIDIHDDVIDQSKTKLNRPTVYGKFGKEIALLIGDALLLKGFTLLHEASKKLPSEKVHAIFDVLKKAYFELGEAEIVELRLKRQRSVKVEEYMEVVRKKASTLEAYMRISALLAGGTEKEIEALAQYGRVLGMLIVIGDDNADMLDHKELINRVKNEVPPLPVICALEKPHLKEKIMQILQKKKLTKKDAEEIFDTIYEAKIFGEIETYFVKLINDGIDNLGIIKNRRELELVIASVYPK